MCRYFQRILEVLFAEVHIYDDHMHVDGDHMHVDGGGDADGGRDDHMHVDGDDDEDDGVDDEHPGVSGDLRCTLARTHLRILQIHTSAHVSLYLIAV